MNRSLKEFDNDTLKRLSVIWNNPFLVDFKLKARSFKFAGKDMDIGEGDDAWILSDVILSEHDKFTKVYCSPDRRKHLALLSPRSLHLYYWIIQNIDDGSDLIWINRHLYMRESEIKRQETFVGALAGLIDNSVLSKAPKYTDLYWINPYFFFKGNRIKKYKNLITKQDIVK